MFFAYNLLDFLAVSRETLKNTITFCSECVPCTYFTSVFFRLSCLFLAFTGYIHAYGVIYTFIYGLFTFLVYNFLDFLAVSRETWKYTTTFLAVVEIICYFQASYEGERGVGCLSVSVLWGDVWGGALRLTH